MAITVEMIGDDDVNNNNDGDDDAKGDHDAHNNIDHDTRIAGILLLGKLPSFCEYSCWARPRSAHGCILSVLAAKFAKSEYIGKTIACMLLVSFVREELVMEVNTGMPWRTFHSKEVHGSIASRRRRSKIEAFFGVFPRPDNPNVGFC